MTETDLNPEALPAGPDGVLVRFALTPDPAAMAALEVLVAALEAAPPEGVVEIAPALVSVLVRFDPARTRRAALARAVLAEARRIARERPAPPAPKRRWTIPAAFGGRHGPQLAELAERAGMSEEACVEAICEADLRVLTIGFAPGQPYIGLLPEAFDIPRLSELTPQVPGGAIVVAVRQIVLFGAPSTTGWRQAGQCGFRTFMPARSEPVLLQSGDAIRFERADAAEVESLLDSADGLGGAKLETLT
ncbi:5-oxoprolinase subunit B family protein [Rhodalgimonas zhirmunskyi]|uniref:Allophanate hydrolase subunit 1 n=1 Tax=Rhodalgimonas zhirmunskyi TaxID=2964767 RepID=A0AAJ1U4U6_9RHOB|nr:carboxyltransferase domain-containing protein [Rhodoalgimonas zhirmunskyi]MDQ2093185.1 allophanate hydrolase subunit 1 [Rhodoalgimonas zhirmunskyi]